jgi:endonuclease/exonuclease/phosphatase family metal-dependent hydrolase
MRLVSINTWKGDGDYPRRLGAICTGLSALSPDVVALQEDLRTDDGGMHTAHTVAGALGMFLSWVPARPKNRLVGDDVVACTSGLALLSREPVLEQRILSLPDDPRDGQRLAQCIHLPKGLGGGWLVNLHLTHLPDRPDLRQAQLSVVLNELGNWAGGERWILCGDFNAGPADQEIAACLLPHGTLKNAFSGAHKVTHVDDVGQPHDLDQIFFRTATGRGTEVRDAWVALNHPGDDGVMASDHCAVCADLF